MVSIWLDRSLVAFSTARTSHWIAVPAVSTQKGPGPTRGAQRCVDGPSDRSVVEEKIGDGGDGTKRAGYKASD